MNCLHMLLFLSIITCPPCSAIIGEYYQICYSSKKYSGGKSSAVKYTVIIDQDEKIECQLLGYSNYDTESICEWEFKNAGLMSNRTVNIIWDRHNNYPAIKCKSTTKNINFDWSREGFKGDLTCQQRSFEQLFLKEQ